MDTDIVSAADPATGVTAFTFGDPEGVMDRRDFLSYIEVWNNGRWYEPPVSLVGLAKARFVSPHHASAIAYKRNQLLRHFEPTRYLDSRNFGEFVLNLLTMGNGYFERTDNLARKPLALRNSPALYTRRGLEEGRYWWVPGYKQEVEFRRDSVFHLFEPDLTQEIYGLPEYLGALQSGFLNEQATLFRRRYYANGSHAGFIFYLNEATLQQGDVDAIRQAMKDAKGPGNFRNLFIHAPAGKPDGVKIIPIAEVAAKDEFLGIKNTTRDDILAAHRVPPQLLGVVPINSGGFGDVSKAADVFYVNEIEPIWTRLFEVNEWLGVEAVRRREYEPLAKGEAAPAAA